MFWDTHCHIDLVLKNKGYEDYEGYKHIGIICPCTNIKSIPTIIDLGNSRTNPNIYFSLGIHPLYSKYINESHIKILHKCIEHQLMQNNPKFIGVGEIGLDAYYDISLEQQIFVFEQQLILAKTFSLPVIIHTRKTIDIVLKYIRKYNINAGGILHAFNGSLQQAKQAMQHNLYMGFGGTMSYASANNIHKLAAQIDMNHIMLETDAPDMPPSWLSKNGINTPDNIIRYAEILANIRKLSLADIEIQLQQNVHRLFNI
jgi:TatD DNase family protein